MMPLKRPIPYIPPWKLETALDNNLLLYRVFERKSVVGILVFRNLIRIPWLGYRIWIWMDRVYRLFSRGKRSRHFTAQEIIGWVEQVDRDIDGYIARRREKAGISGDSIREN